MAAAEHQETTTHEQRLRRFGIAPAHFADVGMAQRRAERCPNLGSAWAKRARGHEALADGRHEARTAIITGVAAPLLLGWIHEVVQQACAQGIDRLVFVQRDGLILERLARIVADQVAPGLKTSLVYGSRQTWVLAAAAEQPESWVPVLLPIRRDRGKMTTQTASVRLGLPPDWCAGGKEGSLQDNLLDWLDDSGQAASWQADLRSQRDACCTYLWEHGIGADERWAFVDLGTGGTLHLALCELLKRAGRRQPEHAFYWGLEAARPLPFLVRPVPYMFDVERGIDDGDVRGMLTFLESICTAPFGTTVGYTSLDSAASTAVLGEAPTGLEPWGLSQMHQVLADMAKKIDWGGIASGGELERHQLRAASIDVFKKFWSEPTRAEAQAWGEAPFEDGWGLERTVLPLAPRITLRRLAAVPSRGRLGFVHRHAWDQGSLVLTSRGRRAVYRAGIRLGHREQLP